MESEQLLAELEQRDELDDLTSFLNGLADPDDTRRTLFDLLRTVVSYETATEWATAVRVCEALAIVGWGELERVDACSRYNGDCWETFFINARGENRFRMGRWHKRAAGWVLFNPEYHFSKDLPDQPAHSWKAFSGVEFPVVSLAALPSQRNYQKQMPIIMGVVGAADAASELVFELKRELTAHLTASMAPAVYGDALERFYFTLQCPTRNAEEPVTIKVGAYRRKERAFYCDAFFSSEFSYLDRDRQIICFRDALGQAVDALETKLKKRKVGYDLASFRADIDTAVTAWRESP